MTPARCARHGHVRRRAPGGGRREPGAGRFAESLEALPPTHTHTHTHTQTQTETQTQTQTQTHTHMGPLGPPLGPTSDCYPALREENPACVFKATD